MQADEIASDDTRRQSVASQRTRHKLCVTLSEGHRRSSDSRNKLSPSVQRDSHVVQV